MIVQVFGVGLLPISVRERDGQTVELGVGGLRDDLVEDLEFGMATNPGGDGFAEELAVPCFRRGEHLQPIRFSSDDNFSRR